MRFGKRPRNYRRGDNRIEHTSAMIDPPQQNRMKKKKKTKSCKKKGGNSSKRTNNGQSSRTVQFEFQPKLRVKRKPIVNATATAEMPARPLAAFVAKTREKMLC